MPPISRNAIDAGLSQRALSGDRAAFDALFERCFAPVFARATRNGLKGAAAEAFTARVLREAFASMPPLRDQGDVAAWLLHHVHEVESSSRTPARERGELRSVRL